MNKEYSLVPQGAEVLHVDTRSKFSFTLNYKPKPRLKILKETFRAQDYYIRGHKTGGVRLAAKEADRVDTRV